jgi:hypothetical protein
MVLTRHNVLSVLEQFIATYPRIRLADHRSGLRLPSPALDSLVRTQQGRRPRRRREKWPEKIVQVREAELEQEYKQAGRINAPFMNSPGSPKTGPGTQIVTRPGSGRQGNSPRSIENNLDLSTDAFYDDLYCQRGETGIKKNRLDFFEWPN